jgi:hypothetical protein
MNTRIERVMNSKNLGARIMQNGDLDQKIWALGACRGKMVISVGFGVTPQFLKWLEGLGTKYRIFPGILVGFWSVWSGLGPIRK